MPRAEINDYRDDLTAGERASLRTPLFREATGEAAEGDLAWGEEVEVLERDGGRARVRAGDGRVGWVEGEHAVEIGFLARRRRGGRWDYTSPLYRTEDGDDVVFDLMWGDRLQILRRGEHRSRVHARGGWGWVSNRAIGDASLLEVYFIDVGQGDGVLIRTPDHRHVLVDGGYRRAQQPTGKNAADFVDWKFFQDYGDHRIRLDAMIASHCDAGHYGGLWDLVSDDERDRAELDCSGADVAAFFHAGVSWWRHPGRRGLGHVEDGHLVDLLGDRQSVVDGLAEDADPQLQGWWADFLEDALEVAPEIGRLGVPEGEEGGWVPGFEPGAGPGTLKVLAPVDPLPPGSQEVERIG